MALVPTEKAPLRVRPRTNVCTLADMGAAGYPSPWSEDRITDLALFRASATKALRLMGEELPPDAYENTAVHMINREPASRSIRHPQVIAAAKCLKQYPAMGVRCQCGRGLGWVALATMSTGLFLVHSDKRQQKKSLRHGGYTDLAPVGGGSCETFTLAPWNAQLPHGIGAVRSSTTLGGLFGPDTPGVLFDCAARVTYECPKCHAQYPLRNDAFVRRFLQAVIDGDGEIRLTGRSSNASHSKISGVNVRDAQVSRRGLKKEPTNGRRSDVHS